MKFPIQIIQSRKSSFVYHRVESRKGRLLLIKQRLTQRAADKWDSARFTSLCLALGFIRLPSRVSARPLAANASR